MPSNIEKVKKISPPTATIHLSPVNIQNQPFFSNYLVPLFNYLSVLLTLSLLRFVLVYGGNLGRTTQLISGD